jgi:glycosyltransferase involved in cell wall biosynthesis
VLVFRKRLLPWSETFIAAQGGALRRYHPVFVGYERMGAGDEYLAGFDVEVLAENSLLPPLSRGLYKATGYLTPGWRNAIQAHDPVLIHAHFGGNGAAAMPVARLLEIPLVVTYHGMDITVKRGARELRRRSRVFACASRVVAVSEFIAARLRAAGCPESKLSVHHIGVDTTFFSPGENGATESHMVLFVGRLVEKKGLVHLIRAMRVVQQQVPSARLVVAGDGPLRGELSAQARSSGVRCEFAGVLPPEQIRELSRRAALLCAPSVTAANGDAEGLGMVLVEAQACGTPVIAFDSGGAGESVIPGKTGFVVKERDEETLAARIGEILTDPVLRGRLSTAAREHALLNFDLRRQTALLEDLYDSVIEESRELTR